MIHKLLTREQIEKGYIRFLEKNPLALMKVNNRSQQIEIILGKKLSNIQYIETANILVEYAETIGIDSFEYLLLYAVESVEERQKIILLRDELTKHDYSVNKYTGNA
ncbi:hypothetical protein [Comamonas koreensis]|uniref:hypothetical protein n=1 Tax=Comamonas koreensis TaxID=160825 RepID=UPI0015F92E6A|nr:hypothetical protein [Comamonas koreensis]